MFLFPTQLGNTEQTFLHPRVSISGNPLNLAPDLESLRYPPSTSTIWSDADHAGDGIAEFGGPSIL